VYPQFVCDTLAKLMYIGERPKQKLSSTLMAEVRTKLGLSWLNDLRGALKL
jgi:hypothetical protein